MEQSIEKQAREMTEAARELRRAVDRLAELHERPDRVSALTELLGSGGLPEVEAARPAREAVHDVRADISREREAGEEELPPPAPEEIREWERRREERRRREDYYQPR